MPTLVLFGLAAVLLWSLVSRRLERWGVAGPVMLLALGAATTVWDLPRYAATIEAPATEKTVELILSLLLFADATEVRGGIFGGEGRITARLVLIALPTSLILTVAMFVLLVPEFWALGVVVACIVMPTDFAPAPQLLRTNFLRERTRAILNVESGYNDGLVSPVFGMALPVAAIVSPLWQEKNMSRSDTAAIGDPNAAHAFEKAWEAFLNAAPATLWAVAIGVVLGALFGWIVRKAREFGLTSEIGARYVMLLLPLGAYGVAAIPEANGFVAAFVAGLMYRVTRTQGMAERTVPHAELLLVEEMGTLTVAFVWFMLGGAAALVFGTEFDWRVVLLATLALTIIRLGPVYLPLLRSSVRPRDRVRIGLLGPRGTATIVFGLLAYHGLDEASGNIVLEVTVVSVVGSVLFHGVIAPYVLARTKR